jgi:hypothetical protein
LRTLWRAECRSIIGPVYHRNHVSREAGR